MLGVPSSWKTTTSNVASLDSQQAPQSTASGQGKFSPCSSPLSGTLFLYQGQEIGMVNVPDSWSPEEYKDIDSIKYWNEMMKKFPSDKQILDKALNALKNGGRDNARTPMQWNASQHAGFTTGTATPWMRAHDNYPEVNVEAALKDQDSIYHFWQQVLKVRKEHSEVFIEGGYEVYDKANPDTSTIVKTIDGEPRALLVLNFSDKEQSDPIPEGWSDLNLLITNADGNGKDQLLDAWEGAVDIISRGPRQSEE